MRLLVVSALLASAALAQAPSPAELVARAPRDAWRPIAPADLLVLELRPLARGKPRRVVIQLMPPPFSQGWVGNVRRLAAAHWWDGLTVNRVQENYVVQWGDPLGDDPAKAKPLPSGLVKVAAADYVAPVPRTRAAPGDAGNDAPALQGVLPLRDAYAAHVGVTPEGWPFATDGNAYWPVHCPGMVGVGRDVPPDTGSGAELYVVSGHAPRHLDRNLGLVGRVIEGLEHLTSLPRGGGALGFYETAAERVPISSVRLGTEVKGLPAWEYLSPTTPDFAAYVEARMNRRDPFFVAPAAGADVCNVLVPVRRVK